MDQAGAPKPGGTFVLALDPVIEEYKKNVDRSLLRENLKLTPAERLLKLEAFMRSLGEMQDAARTVRR